MNGNGGAIRIPRPPFPLYRGPAISAAIAIAFGALAAFGFLTFRADRSPGFYIFMAIMAGLMFALCLGSTWWYAILGGTLRVHDDRVELGVRSNTPRVFRYADIETLTIRESRRYGDNRETVAFNRTITINDTRVRYIALPQDALDPLLAIVVERVAAERRAVAGDGWKLEGGALHWRGEATALASITHVGVYEGELRAWRRGEEEHFFAISMNAANARVLQRRLPVSPAGDTLPLGRLLFTRRTSRIVLALQTLTVVIIAALVNHPLFWALSALAVLRALLLLGTRYRFHERAVTRATLFTKRTLNYADVAAMTWKENLTALHAGVQTGVRVTVKLVPADGSSPLRVNLRRFRAEDDDLDPVRDALAVQIATRMRDQLRRGESVPWTRDATFTPNGLQLKKALWPYSRPIHYELRDGYLHLYANHGEMPIALLPASAPNFFPGFALFHELM